MFTPQEFLSVLPFACAAAISPLLFTVALLVASQKTNSAFKSAAFLLGSFGSILTIGVLIFIFLSKLSSAKNFTKGDAFTDLFIGLLLLAFAIFQLRSKKPKKNTNNNISIFKAFSLGVILMSVNSSSIIMFLPAAHLASNYSDAVKLEILMVMIIFALLPAIIPPALLRLVQSQSQIDKIKSIVATKGQYIVAAVFVLMGILEIVKGLEGLL